MASEALDLHIAGMAADHRDIPAPSRLDTIMDDPANRAAVTFLVDFQTKATRPKLP
jgi:hypothetical protein